jgi:Flp pilus assembly protein TadD
VSGTSFQLPPAASEAERIAQDLYQERIGWPDAQDRLRQYYRSSGDKQGYARVTAILGDAFPFVGQLQFETAAALIDVGQPAAALRYARRAAELEPRNVNALLVHAHALLLLGRTAPARTLLEQVLSLEPGNATARDAMQELNRN